MFVSYLSFRELTMGKCWKSRTSILVSKSGFKKELKQRNKKKQIKIILHEWYNVWSQEKCLHTQTMVLHFLEIIK